MPSTLRKALVQWAPVPVYVGLIFLASSMSRLPFKLPVAWFDKVLHFSEYALLAILVTRAVRPLMRPWVAWLVTVVAVLACGSLDELYQGTVANRNSDVFDLIADGLGGLVGSLTYLWLSARWRARKLLRSTGTQSPGAIRP